MDGFSNNLTRPSAFYVSQAIIGFASLLFLAQTMVIGMARTLLAGGKNFVSFVVLFSLSQNLGGLIGTSLLGTFQVIREKFHSHELVQALVATDPLVAGRLHGTTGALAGTVGDPALRGALGAGTLAGQISREANILAYNDVFMLIGVLAGLTLLWGLAIHWSIRLRGETSPVIQLQQRMVAAAARGPLKSEGQ
jgi:hypothetical protein